MLNAILTILAGASAPQNVIFPAIQTVIDTRPLILPKPQNGVFIITQDGWILVQLLGSGSVPTATISTLNAGNAMNLNNNSSLATGTIYEFQFYVQQGDQITFAGCTVLRASLIPFGVSE